MISEPVLVASLVPSAVADDFRVKPELLIASARVVVLTSLFSLPAATVVVPFVLVVPLVTGAVRLETLTSTFTTLTLSVVVILTVVPVPFMKLTVLYGVTRSLAVPFSCRFQPAFNTSPNVAALVVFTLSGNVPDLPSFTVLGTGKVVVKLLMVLLPSTVPIVIGLVVMVSPAAFL